LSAAIAAVGVVGVMAAVGIMAAVSLRVLEVEVLQAAWDP
jgi:hypothetical protein